MIVYAVYFISETGTPLLSEYFQSADNMPNEILLGGLFTALQGVAAELSQDSSRLKSIEIEGLSYHIRSFELYKIVIVTNIHKNPGDILQTLGLRFMKVYGDVLIERSGLINLREFQPFSDTVREIVHKFTASDESHSLQPSKKLGTGEIFNLPHELQSTALAIVLLVEGSIKDIAKESGESEEETLKFIMDLQELGYIGKRVTDKNKAIFFCSL